MPASPSAAHPDRPVPDPTVQDAKRRYRADLTARRRARPPAERAAARRAVADHLSVALTGVATVCAYAPLPTEPLPPDLLDDLETAGTAVLLPRVAGARPLDWVRHVPGAALPPALAAPGGSAGPGGQIPERLLGPAAVAAAEVILVPALAVDSRGYRLGRGGGHYDRTLALAAQLSDRPRRIIAVVHDDELVDALPADALDVRVGWVVTPVAGLQRRVTNT